MASLKCIRFFPAVLMSDWARPQVLACKLLFQETFPKSHSWRCSFMKPLLHIEVPESLSLSPGTNSLWKAYLSCSTWQHKTQGHSNMQRLSGEKWHWVCRFLTASGYGQRYSRWVTTVVCCCWMYILSGQVKYPTITHMLYWLNLHFKYRLTVRTYNNCIRCTQ